MTSGSVFDAPAKGTERVDKMRGYLIKYSKTSKKKKESHSVNIKFIQIKKYA